MIQDLLALESYFGQQEPQFWDEILERYGEDCCRHAVCEGYVTLRQVCLGPDCGRFLCALSEKGRMLAEVSSF